MKPIFDFIRELHAVPSNQFFFNFYRDLQLDCDASAQSPEIRREQLTRYLVKRASAKLVLIAQAPGYYGQRFTGIPLVSERQLLGHKLATCGVQPSSILPGNIERTSSMSFGGGLGYSERTSTRVGSMLVRSGVDAGQIVFWNAFPFLKNDCSGLSVQSIAELNKVGLRFLEQFLAMYSGVPVIAMGKVARRCLDRLNMPYISAVSLPTRGGDQLQQALLELKNSGF